MPVSARSRKGRAVSINLSAKPTCWAVATVRGSSVLSRTDLLLSGTPRVVIDPDPGNERAIRAYEKAGFCRDRIVDTPDGPALLMVRDP